MHACTTVPFSLIIIMHGISNLKLINNTIFRAVTAYQGATVYPGLYMSIEA